MKLQFTRTGFVLMCIAFLVSSCTSSFYQQKYTNFGHRKTDHHFTQKTYAHEPVMRVDSGSGEVSCSFSLGDTTQVVQQATKEYPQNSISPLPAFAEPASTSPNETPAAAPMREDVTRTAPEAPAPAPIFFGLGVLLIVLLIVLAVILGLAVNPYVGVILAGLGIALLIIFLKRRAGPKPLHIPDNSNKNGSNEDLPENERPPAPEMTDRELAGKNIRALGVISIVLALVLAAVIIFGVFFPGALIVAVPLLIMLILHRVWINRLKRIVNPRRNPNEKRVRMLDVINWIALGLTAAFVALCLILASSL